VIHGSGEIRHGNGDASVTVGGRASAATTALRCAVPVAGRSTRHGQPRGCVTAAAITGKPFGAVPDHGEAMHELAVLAGERDHVTGASGAERLLAPAGVDVRAADLERLGQRR
jgi:hypothetical protein